MIVRLTVKHLACEIKMILVHKKILTKSHSKINKQIIYFPQMIIPKKKKKIGQLSYTSVSTARCKIKDSNKIKWTNSLHFAIKKMLYVNHSTNIQVGNISKLLPIT